MFIVGDLCQVFPMKTGFTKCHFCGRIASTCVGRSVYSTLIWRALRAQMSNFNLRLASSSGPRCPISTCVWRAHSGPRYSMFQLTSGELTPGPDFQIQLSSGELLSGPRCSVCVNFRLASSSRAQIDRSSTNEKEKKRGWRTRRGRLLPPRSSAAFCHPGVGCYSERVEGVPRRCRMIENHES